MGVKIGESGGFAVLAEATYGTVGTVANRVWMPVKSSNIVNVREMMEPNYLVNTPSKRRFNVGYSQGQTVLPYCRSRAISQIILDMLGSYATNVHTFPAASGTPTNNVSATVWQDTGGHRMRFTGCVPTKFGWNISANQPVLWTVDWLGRIGTANDDVVALSMTKTDDDIMMWSDVGATITIAGAAVIPNSMTIEVAPQQTGPDRWAVGASYHRKPQRFGRWNITGSMTFDLDDTDTGDVNNTVALITSLLAYSSTAVGSIVVGDWTFSNCWFTGEIPTLDAGITPCVINFTANSLALTTAA